MKKIFIILFLLSSCNYIPVYKSIKEGCYQKIKNVNCSAYRLQFKNYLGDLRSNKCRGDYYLLKKDKKARVSRIDIYKKSKLFGTFKYKYDNNLYQIACFYYEKGYLNTIVHVLHTEGNIKSDDEKVIFIADTPKQKKKYKLDSKHDPFITLDY